MQVLKAARSLIETPECYSTEAPCIHHGQPVIPFLGQKGETTWDVYGAVQATPSSAPDRREALYLLAYCIPNKKTHPRAVLLAQHLSHQEALDLFDAAIDQATRETYITYCSKERALVYEPSPASPHRMAKRRR